MSFPETLTLSRLPPFLFAALEEGRRVAVLVTVVAPDATQLGKRLLVLPDSERGSLGDPLADAEGARLAREALEGGIQPGTLTLPSATGGELTAFLELHHPSPELVVVGAGHVAQPLATMGALLGFQVKVLDDRPQFATRERFPDASELIQMDFSDPFAEVPIHHWSHVVLVTRGHKFDYECLRHILRGDPMPAYLGMIGSRRRVRATFDALREEGIPTSRLERVRAPIGLDLGGETPAEIAVSIVAEIVQQGAGGTGRPLSEMERVLSRFQSGPEGVEEG
jgi:xanthine dehydrogenase accessory factor